jgi:glycolate oxidase iron-sulfur subunit
VQTSFTLAQLADPEIAEANKILRACVHCGFCTATCPTYVLLGDELDSPRGRIYLMKDMLEGDKPASPQVVKHIDRCLSCLSCMTTCPSDVHYMHLVDLGRRHIEETYRRPLPDRLLRQVLAAVLPRPALFRLSLLAGRLVKPLAPLLGARLGAMLGLLPARLASPSPVDRPQVFPAAGPRQKRVALLSGCAQQVLAPEINEATIRLLTRHGCEVVVARGAGCCGALTHHLGKDKPALDSAAGNIRAWQRELEGEGLDAVVINASGCGTMVKDYGFLFREDAILAKPAAAISALARDITELMSELGLQPRAALPPLSVVYHSACSLQHGQKISELPPRLLREAGFTVREPAEGHLCCGSAGSYNLLQPALAGRLRDRKVANLERTGAAVVATGNIGCIAQIASGSALPVVHSVELLDWATGGPRPKALAAV